MLSLNKNQNGLVVALIFVMIMIIGTAGLVGYLYYKKHISRGTCPPGKIVSKDVGTRGATKTLVCILPPIHIHV